jgi:transcriptional regulator with XRE-family HTH domain
MEASAAVYQSASSGILSAAAPGGASRCPAFFKTILPTHGDSRTISAMLRAISTTLFHERLRREFESRRSRNSRYSLRAFAAFLRADHSTLSQIFRGARRVPAGRIRVWAKLLGMGAEEIALYVAAESAPAAAVHQKHEQLRHWTAEAAGIMNSPLHLQIVRLSRRPDFRADCRWIAGNLAVEVDAVNIALSRLLRLRLLAATSPNQWKDTTGIAELTESAFLSVALERVRECAGEFHPVMMRNAFGGQSV